MKRNKLRIGVLHYHLLRGGVRTVIENALRALITHGDYECLEIDLISSDARQRPGQELTRQLQHCPERGNCGAVAINQIELADLAYDQTPAADPEQLYHQAGRLADELSAEMNLTRSTKDNPYVLYVHNGNLGKNPRVTLAMKLLADRFEQNDLPAWLLYQMHDFAEDHRPLCWQALRDCSGLSDRALAVKMMYPPSERIRWVCINSADRERLISVGLDPQKIDVLPNAVDTETFCRPTLNQITPEQLKKMGLEPIDFTADLKCRIGRFAERNGFRFEPQRRILLAPIKTIRRKNIAESVLLLMASNARQDCRQLLVTLGANSKEDMEYCRAIEEFVKRNRLPVVIGLGQELLAGHQRQIKDGYVEAYSLIDLLDISEAIVTTSVQEGFGYVFHEPWLAGKAVLGRNIERVTRDFRAAGMQLDHLYDHLLIPRHWLGDQWHNLCRTYAQKVNSLRKAAGLEPQPESLLIPPIEQKKTHNLYNQHNPNTETLPTVDWADLTAGVQLDLLQRLIDGELKTECLCWINKAFGPSQGWYIGDMAAIICTNAEVVARCYDLATKAHRLITLIDQGSQQPDRSEGGSLVHRTSNQAIFAESLEPAGMRLLA